MKEPQTMNDPEKIDRDVFLTAIMDLLAAKRQGLSIPNIAAHLVGVNKYPTSYVIEQIEAALTGLAAHGQIRLMGDRYWPADMGPGLVCMIPVDRYECMMKTLTEEVTGLVAKLETRQDSIVVTGQLHGLISALVLFEVRSEEQQPKDLIQRAQVQLDRMKAKLDDPRMFWLGGKRKALYEGMSLALADNEAGKGDSISDGWEMLGMARALDLLELWPEGADRDDLLRRIESQINKDMEGMRARFAPK